jgi:hypothetical protein
VMRIGSRWLSEFPSDVVRIECERCGRAGSYELEAAQPLGDAHAESLDGMTPATSDVRNWAVI